MTVGVRVTDGRGRDIPNFKASDFSLYENGVLQDIATFSSEEQPITLGILLDHSDSMAAQKLVDAKEAARTLVRSVRPGSEFFYITFDFIVSLESSFSTDRALMITAIEATGTGVGTSLYAAVREGQKLAAGAGLPRQVLVVISDGADQHSDCTLKELIAGVKESRVQIYTIGYFTDRERNLYQSGRVVREDGKPMDNPIGVLNRIARESGAEAFFPNSDEQLAKAIARIADDLRCQYTLAYYPSSLPKEGEYRRIQVKVRGNSYKVRARPGYGSLVQRRT